MSDTTQKILNFAHTRPMIFSLSLMLFSGFCLIQSGKTLFPPPEIVTHYRFTVIEKRICLYLKNSALTPPSDKNSHIKNSLNQDAILPSLPQIAGEDNSIADGWNFPIHYEKTEPNLHKLLSYGQDGVPGGKPDIVYQFRAL